MWPLWNASGTYLILPTVARESTPPWLCLCGWGQRQAWDVWDECHMHPVVFLLCTQSQRISLHSHWLVLNDGSVMWHWDRDVEGSSRHLTRSAFIFSYSSWFLSAQGASPPYFWTKVLTYKFWLYWFSWHIHGLLCQSFCRPPFPWNHFLIQYFRYSVFAFCWTDGHLY